MIFIETVFTFIFILSKMNKLNAVITGIGAYVPEAILTNADLCNMVDTTDEWIVSRVGIKERRVLDKNLGMSYMAIRAVNELIQKTGIDPASVDSVICATSTGDYPFPPTASIIAYQTGCKNAFAFDVQAACAGFVFGLETASNFVRSGRYKRIIFVAGDKMTAITDYADRSTCPLFGDGCGAVLMEPTTDAYGVIDSILRTNGEGFPFLHMKAGGSANVASHATVDNREHFVYQEGKTVFKRAVSDMADVASEIIERNGLTKNDINWIVPHQANLRIIDAAARRLGVDVSKIMINIQRYGNTSSGTIPLCLWERKHKSGFVNIIGNPNVGKSTLMNLLVGERISIITSKAQTTRHRILGIVNTDDMQIVYSDTPGVLRPNYKLQQSMLTFAESALNDADVLIYVTDTVEKTDKNEAFLQKVEHAKSPVLLLINKIDLIDQTTLEQLVAQWQLLLTNAKIIPIAARSKFNIETVKQHIISLLPDSPPYFDKDVLTDRPARFFVTEIIREKILLYYQREIPYATEVVVEQFTELPDKIHIKTVIIVERETQKGIIIGHQAQALKKVGTMARKDMEFFFAKKIFLEMFVKVEKDWRNRDNMLKTFGYQLD